MTRGGSPPARTERDGRTCGAATGRSRLAKSRMAAGTPVAQLELGHPRLRGAEMDDRLFPAPLAAHRRRLRQVAEDGHGPVRTAARHQPELHGRQILGLVDDDVPIGRCHPYSEGLGLVQQGEVGPGPSGPAPPAQPQIGSRGRGVGEHGPHHAGGGQGGPDRVERALERLARPHVTPPRAATKCSRSTLRATLWGRTSALTTSTSSVASAALIGRMPRGPMTSTASAAPSRAYAPPCAAPPPFPARP